MRLRYLWILGAFFLSACNMSVQSLTSAPPPSVEPTDVPTPFADTPTPPAIEAARLESPAFLEVHFVNDLDAWAVTETNIVRTNDGGITWYDLTPPDMKEIGDGVETFILDADHVWIQKPDFNNFPNNGLLYHTADGGETWSISSTPFSGGDLNFVDASHGWMLADLGIAAGSNGVAVFQTADGGATWTQTYTNDPNNPEAGDSLPLGGLKSGLAALDAQTAWIGGVIYSPGTVYLYRTDDGGRTWTPVALDLPEGAENFELSIDDDQMKFVSAQDGYLALYMTGEAPQTAIYTTHDGGNSWTLTATLIPETGQADFISAEEAILYNGEEFYITRDAAATWATVAPNIGFGDSFLAMDFVNADTGWVVTMDASGQRMLYRTQDGGATWLPVVP